METKEHIKKIARDIILKNEIAIPVNLKSVAITVNSIIVYYKLPHNVCGSTIKVKKGKIKYDAEYIIIVNTLQTDTRKRFTVAHEIGHIVMKHHDKLFLCNLNNDKCNILEFKKKLDREADIFASELLMPSYHVERLIHEYGITDIDLLCKFYNVSKSAMEIKIKECSRCTIKVHSNIEREITASAF